QPYANGYLPSGSRLMRAVLGEPGHPQSVRSPDDPLWRRLFAWQAHESVPDGPVPSFARFEREVMPLISKRSCGNTACHAAAEGPLLLLSAPEAAADDWARLLSRVQSGDFPSK